MLIIIDLNDLLNHLVLDDSNWPYMSNHIGNVHYSDNFSIPTSDNDESIRM